MNLFRSLNDGGQTVVMVTHNPENCRFSHRTIHIRDGLVAPDF